MVYFITFIIGCIFLTTTAIAFSPLINKNTIGIHKYKLNTSLYAKKEQIQSKGFGTKKKQIKKENNTDEVKEKDVKNVNEDSLQSSAQPILGSSKAILKEAQSNNGETDAEAIFKKYGIKDGESNKSKTATKIKKNMKNKKKNAKGETEESPFGQSVLANLAPEVQLKIDNTLVTCTFLSLLFVVLSGISISLGAYTIVFPETKIPPELDNIIKNFLSPAFTPALFVFFFFSITFGLFKFAQISSDQTVYKEEMTKDL